MDKTGTKVTHFSTDGKKWVTFGSQVIEIIRSFLEVVPEGGFEPPTLRFSVACSTN